MKDTTEVIGLNVFSVEEGRILGRTVECVVDLATGKVLGLIVEVKDGVEMGIARSAITAVGKDAVMVTSDKVLKPLADIPGLVEHRTTGKAAPRVLTRSGQVLGTLRLVRVDEKCEKVDSYEIAGDVIQAIADGPAILGVIEGTIHGPDAIVLPDTAVSAIKRSGGLKKSFEKAWDTVREAATDVGDRLTDVAKRAKIVGETASAKALAQAKKATAIVEQKVAEVEKKSVSEASVAKDSVPPKKKTAAKRKPTAMKKPTKKKTIAKPSPDNA
ncbi:MAG: PRC-barrel domain-containing protein [Candidatus Zipacnadales bacterium]